MGELRGSFAALLKAVPGPTNSCAEVEESLGIDAKLAWQVLRIARAANPLGAGTSVPARVSMQKLIKAAGKRRVPAGITERTLSAFDKFEELVKEHAGDRERFTSMVGALSREESDDLDLRNKKAMYRCASHLWGVEMRASVHSLVVHSSATPGSLDAVMLREYVDLRRLRCNAPLNIPLGTSRNTQESNNGSAYVEYPLDSIPNAQGTFVLREYCEGDLGGVRVVAGPGSASLVLDVPETVGRKGGITIATGSIARGNPSPYSTPGSPEFICSPRVRLPAEVFLADMLIHREAFPDRHPIPTRVRTFGNVDVDIGTGQPEVLQKMDLLGVREHCEHLGLGIEPLGTPDAPRHLDMLRSVCAAMGWNPDEFQVYRCRVEYPIMRSTVWIDFELGAK